MLILKPKLMGINSPCRGMRKIKRLLSVSLGFTRSQVNGFFIFIFLMLVLIFSEPAWRWWISRNPPDLSADEKVLDSLVALFNTTQAFPNTGNRSDSLFAFNPNKVTIEELQKLGFSKQLSNRIAAYRQKGGVFRVKSDLLKMYGVDSTFYNQLFAYILLPERVKYEEKAQKAFNTVSQKSFSRFDINTADTTQLKTLYGIGSKRARRIIKFRDALGGFYTQKQYNEVYGLDSTVVNLLVRSSFIDEDFKPRQIDINESDEETFSSHPYIGKKLAKVIMAYRYQHGRFNDVNDIRKLNVLKQEDADRIIPYLKVN